MPTYGELKLPTLDTYANQIAFFAYPPAHPLHPNAPKQEKVGMLEAFSLAGLVPQGAEANLDQLTTALNGCISPGRVFSTRRRTLTGSSAGRHWCSRMGARRIQTSGMSTLLWI